MLKNKKALAMSVLCAIASVGFVVSASAAEQTMHGNLDEVVVEGSADVLPGGMAKAKGSVGLLGDKEVMETPFSVTNVSQKTMDLFLGPNEPLDKALVGVPGVRADGSVRIGNSLTFSQLTNKTLTIFCKANNGRGQTRALLVGDNGRFAAFHNGNNAISST